MTRQFYHKAENEKRFNSAFVRGRQSVQIGMGDSGAPERRAESMADCMVPRKKSLAEWKRRLVALASPPVRSPCVR